MALPPSNPFTPAAEQRWKKIPPHLRERILSNVWCGACLGSVRIVLESAEMKKGDLILRGTCATCGKRVCRVVEPEPE